MNGPGSFVTPITELQTALERDEMRFLATARAQLAERVSSLAERIRGPHARGYTLTHTEQHPSDWRVGEAGMEER
jgi:hypothetical protein